MKAEKNDQKNSLNRQDHSESPARYDYAIDLSDDNRSHTKILKMIEPHQVVLEIGCATGFMTRYMQSSLECRVVAVEIDELAAEKARPFCEELIVGDVESLDLETVLAQWQFDVILLADVIEHLKNPTALLKKIKPLLKDTGYMLLSVPNGAHGALALELLDGKWEYRDTGLMDRTHLRFFDKESLSILLEPCGLYIAQLDRVVVHPRDTEMKIPWDSYPREVTAYLEKVNPEYKTYQFVIKAHPMSAVGWRKGLEDALASERSKVMALTQRETDREKLLSRLRGEVNGFEKELQKRQAEYMDGWNREFQRLEDEQKKIHEGYRKQMAILESEKKEIYNGYQEQLNKIEALLKAEQDKALNLFQQLKDTKQDLKVLSDHRRKLFHTLKFTENQLHRSRQHVDEQTRLFWDRQCELDAIKNSIAWKTLTRWRLFIDRRLPENTRRRRFYQLTVLAPKVLVKEGPVSFIKKIASRCIPRRKKDPEVWAVKESGEQTSPLVFPRFNHIRVSIVIPVYNQWSHTYRCLTSLLAHTRVPFEVIVVNNASSDGSRELLESMKGIRTINNPENMGFVQACNQGASEASGDFILFLNNDTEVTEGWLEALLRPFDKKSTGIVGARLVYPAGGLQEAGNIIWSDGSGWNYGRGDDPELPQYSYLKAVDYCSGACLLIKKDLWNEIGGFDMRFAPAYYEDTDLCFAVREKGYRVIYQPESKVIHHEGATAGTDISSGFKRYQTVNHKKFTEKWREVLTRDHHAGPEKLWLARERGAGKCALVVDHYAPTFDQDSGSLRMYSLMGILQDMGYKVVFWPDNMAFDERYTRELQQMGIEALYGDIRFDQYLKDHGRHVDLIILSRPHVAIHYIDAAIAYSDAMIIYDTVDLHCLRESRRAKLEKDDQCRMEAEECAAQWKEKELYLARTADVTLVVSPVEKEILEKEDSLKGKIAVVSNIHTRDECIAGFEERAGLMFIGGFMHTPNEDGIVWFVESILPLVHQQLPDVHLYVVGSHPSERVKCLSSAQVTVTGYMEDVRPYFEKSRVFVSPLRYGAGVKGKIGQSMAFGLPVVTTSVGAEGMRLVDETNALIADDESVFAEKVTRLYQEKELWEKVSKNGLQSIQQNFSMEVARKTLEQLVELSDHRSRAGIRSDLTRSSATTDCT